MVANSISVVMFHLTDFQFNQNSKKFLTMYILFLYPTEEAMSAAI